MSTASAFRPLTGTGSAGIAGAAERDYGPVDDGAADVLGAADDDPDGAADDDPAADEPADVEPWPAGPRCDAARGT